MKKWLIVVSVLAVLLGGAGVYWYLQQKPSVVSDPIDAIPVDASLILSFPDLHTTLASLQEQEYAQVLNAIDFVSPWLKRQSVLDSILLNDPRVHQLLGGSSVWMSYHTTASDSLDHLWVLPVKNGSDAHLVEAWKQHLAKSGAAVTEQLLGETTVYRSVVAQPYSDTHFAVKNGLLLISSSGSMLRASLMQLSGGATLRTDSNFMSAVETAGKNVDMNIFIQYARLPAYLRGAMKAGIPSVETVVSEFAHWTEFDLNFKAAGLTFNGFTYANDSLPQFLSIFNGQRPQAIRFPDFIPSNTASFVFFGFDDVIALSSK